MFLNTFFFKCPNTSVSIVDILKSTQYLNINFFCPGLCHQWPSPPSMRPAWKDYSPRPLAPSWVGTSPGSGGDRGMYSTSACKSRDGNPDWTFWRNHSQTHKSDQRNLSAVWTILSQQCCLPLIDTIRACVQVFDFPLHLLMSVHILWKLKWEKSSLFFFTS